MTLLLDTSPNEIAQQLTNRDYISYSSISTYQACPLRWHFRYVLGLPEETVSSSLIFGAAIHRAVERHYRELLAGNQPPDLDALLFEYQVAWREIDLGAVKFCKGEGLDDLGQLAERLLLAFQSSPAAIPVGHILGVEEELRGVISSDCPELLARIDLLMDEGDELVVVDLKTAKARWSQHQAEDSGEQLLLYSELAKDLMPGKSLRLEFLVVTKAKTPVVETHTVKLDSSRIERTKRVVEQTWKAIQAGNIYPSPSALNCGSCPFREPCRQWRG